MTNEEFTGNMGAIYRRKRILAPDTVAVNLNTPCGHSTSVGS
jgi:hypothetical protein